MYLLCGCICYVKQNDTERGQRSQFRRHRFGTDTWHLCGTATPKVFSMLF